MVSLDFFKQNPIHYKSKSGSLYFYTEKGIYRYSNHWGRVANCRWKIKGIEDYKNQNYYVGYVDWSGFYPLNSSEKAFYLQVDSKTGETKINRTKEIENSAHFLMTLDFAYKRIKEIKTLFKDYKWALYYNEDIEVLRGKLINKLINSNESYQMLKRSLGSDFE